MPAEPVHAHAPVATALAVAQQPSEPAYAREPPVGDLSQPVEVTRPSARPAAAPTHIPRPAEPLRASIKLAATIDASLGAAEDEGAGKAPPAAATGPALRWAPSAAPGPRPRLRANSSDGSGPEAFSVQNAAFDTFGSGVGFESDGSGTPRAMHASFNAVDPLHVLMDSWTQMPPAKRTTDDETVQLPGMPASAAEKSPPRPAGAAAAPGKGPAEFGPRRDVSSHNPFTF